MQNMDQQNQYIPEPIRNVILTHEPIIGCLEYLGYIKNNNDVKYTPETLALLVDILCKIITSTDVIGVAKGIELSEQGKDFVNFLYDVTAKYSYVHIEQDNRFLIVKQNENLINFFVDCMSVLIKDDTVKPYGRLDTVVGIMQTLSSGSIIDNKKGFTQQVNFLLGLVLKYVIGNSFTEDIKNISNRNAYLALINDHINTLNKKLNEAKDDSYAINSYYFPLIDMIKSVIESKLK